MKWDLLQVIVINGESEHGVKREKQRITVLLETNMGRIEKTLLEAIP